MAGRRHPTDDESNVGPIYAKTKGDPTDFRAMPTRGVPQGAPSSPIYFNMHIDEVAKEVIQRVTTQTIGKGTAIWLRMMSSSKQPRRQRFKNYSMWRRGGQKEAQRSVQKCAYLSLPRGRGNWSVTLGGAEVKLKRTEKYFGMTLMADCLKNKHNIHRLSKPGKETQALGCVGGSMWH